jgi:hypothetical protein
MGADNGGRGIQRGVAGVEGAMKILPCVHLPVRPRLRLASLRALAAFALLTSAQLLGVGSGLSAQQVQGRVLEEGEGILVHEAWVELLGDGGISLLRTLTDEQGAFTLQAPAPGEYRLRASRSGYTFRLTDPLTLERGATERVFLSLALRPFVLDSLVVAGERRPGARSTGQAKFLERAGSGGVFLDAARIAGAASGSLSDVVLGVEGFQRGEAGALRSDRGEGCLMLFLNDFAVQALSLDEIPPGQVMGMEVYRESSLVPGELRGQSGRCAAVNVWLQGAW